MLNPERLMRLVIEIIFVLLGLLLVWLGVTRHILFDRHSLLWLVLSIALIFWGIRNIYAKPGRKPPRPEDYIRAVSLALLGVLLLAISRVPFGWVAPLLAAAGFLLAGRGIIGTVILLRSPKTIG